MHFLVWSLGNLETHLQANYAYIAIRISINFFKDLNSSPIDQNAFNLLKP